MDRLGGAGNAQAEMLSLVVAAMKRGRFVSFVSLRHKPAGRMLHAKHGEPGRGVLSVAVLPEVQRANRELPAKLPLTYAYTHRLRL